MVRAQSLGGLLAVVVCLAPGAYAQRTTSFAAGVGRVERNARTLPWPKPSPRRTKRVEAIYPRGVQGITGIVTLQVTLDPDGRVVECRPLEFTALGPGAAGDEKTIATAFVASTTDAVNAWEYEKPAKAPVTFMMAVVLHPPSIDAVAPAATDVYLTKEEPPLKKIKDLAPTYPIQASTRQIQGVIVLDATVAPDGRVIDARVLRAIPYLDQAALTAAAQWEFDVGRFAAGGERRNVVAELSLNFELR